MVLRHLHCKIKKPTFELLQIPYGQNHLKNFKSPFKNLNHPYSMKSKKVSGSSGSPIIGFEALKMYF